MDTIAVNCNHCGASLQVPEGARFVTCRYCNSQLEIKRTDSTITTQVLERIDQTTTAMAQDLHAIRRDSEVERLDREWNLRQAALLTRDKNGNVSPPSAAAGIIGAVVMGGFGIFWTILAVSITSAGSHASTVTVPGMPVNFTPPAMPDDGPSGMVSCLFPLFGIAFVIGAIALGIKSVINAGKYAEEERRYQQQRSDLLRQQPAAPNDS